MSGGKPVLNSLWVGNSLGFVERLCLKSALGTGHHFRLYSYEPDKLQGVPEGVELSASPAEARKVRSDRR